jgi:tetratricopeptide (TPR) repeat protein
MQLLDGLYLYEVVLLALGVVLFLVVLAAFVALLSKGKSYSKLLPFLLVSLLMMGYPSVKSVSYNNGVVTVDTATTELQENPTDATVRQKLQTAVQDTAARPTTDPKILAAIAAGQFALGDHSAAETNLKMALQKSPQLPAALALEKRIALNSDLQSLTTELAQHPQDDAAKAKLAQAVAQGSALKIASPTFITNLARAQAAVGNKNQALALTDRALKIQPNLKEAMVLQKQITPAK